MYCWACGRARDSITLVREKNGIGFIPYCPLAEGGLADSGGALAKIAAAHDATPAQVALAWLLARSREARSRSGLILMP